MPDSSALPGPPGTEVLRPARGLARGIWELPALAFYAAGVALVLLSALYVMRRRSRTRRLAERKSQKVLR